MLKCYSELMKCKFRKDFVLCSQVSSAKILVYTKEKQITNKQQRYLENKINELN